MVSYLVVDRRDKLREPTKKYTTLLFDWNTVGPAASSSPKSKVLRFLLLILFLLCMATFLVKVEILSPNFFSASTCTFWVWGLIFRPKTQHTYACSDLHANVNSASARPPFYCQQKSLTLLSQWLESEP